MLSALPPGMSVRATLEADPSGFTGRVNTARFSAGDLQATKASSFRANWQAQLASANSEDASSEDTAACTTEDPSSFLPPTSPFVLSASAAVLPASPVALPCSASAGAGAVVKSDPASLDLDFPGSNGALANSPERHDLVPLTTSVASGRKSSSLRGHEAASVIREGSGKSDAHDGSNQWGATSIGVVPTEIAFQIPQPQIALSSQNELSAQKAKSLSANLDEDAVPSPNLAERQSAGANFIVPVTRPAVGPGASFDVHMADAGGNALAAARMSITESNPEPKVVAARPERLSDPASADQKAIRNAELSKFTEQGNSTNDINPNTRILQGGSSASSTGANDQLEVSLAQPGNVSEAQRWIRTAGSTRNEGTGGSSTPPQAKSLDPIRDANLPPELQRQIPNTGSAAPAGSNTPAKYSSSRIAANSDRAQSVKQFLPGSAETFTPHSLSVSHFSESMEAGIVVPKDPGSIPHDIRLQDPFTALESGSKVGNGTLGGLRGGHIQAEAGYQDPVLGWVGVRAEASGGMVHATLVPPTQIAAEALSGHIAGLHTYLAENHTPVETLNLALLGRDSQEMAQSPGQGMQHGAGQHAGHDSASQPEKDSQSLMHAINSDASRTVSLSNDVLAQSNVSKKSGGRYISVVA